MAIQNHGHGINNKLKFIKLRFAADEDITIQHGMPVLAKSACQWYIDGDEWELKSPQEAIKIVAKTELVCKVGEFYHYLMLYPVFFIHWSIGNRFYL